MEITQNSPTDYINSLPDESKETIAALDKLIVKLLPKERRVMWEGKFWGGSDQKIIGYGKMVFVGSSKKEVEWFLIGLAQQKNYITLFVNGFDGQQYVAEKFKDKVGKAKVGKSTITFKKLDDINLEVVGSLIKRAYELSS